MTIKAKPTWYGNTLYKSRLEIRHAVFLDNLAIEFDYEHDYEHQGKLDELPYLADFYLPDMDTGCYIEIKPENPTALEMLKCKKLAIEKNTSVYCYVGHPRPWKSGEERGPAYMWQPDGTFDFGYNFIQCHYCGEIRIDNNYSNYIKCNECGQRADDMTGGLYIAREVARAHNFDDPQFHYRKDLLGTPQKPKSPQGYVLYAATLSLEFTNIVREMAREMERASSK